MQNNTIETSELIEQTFHFWFNDSNHIRSPFPNYIQNELKELAINKFSTWINNLKSEAEKEINDEIIGEKFEEIIFETAIPLVKTEDEKITILYPFLPRIQDKINNNDNESSIVVDRSIIKKEDLKYLKVILETLKNKRKWETEFELPL